MKKWLVLSLVLVGLLVGFACKGSTTPETKTPPTISSFSASPTTIHRGESSTLSWSVSGATSLTINQGVGTVTGTTSKAVSPTETTTYTLTATNSDGTKTATCTVTIELVLPVINSFVLSPASITRGGSSTLSWDVSGSTSVTIDQGIGTVSATGSRTVNPTATTTYTLTATNNDGPKTATCTLTIDKLYPTIDFFTSNPASIRRTYDISTLAWNVRDATTITIDQGVGTVPATGSAQVSPLLTTIYTISATNIDGTRTASCQVEIKPWSILAITTNPASPISIYNAYLNTTSYNFIGILTESGGVGGMVTHFYVGTFIDANTVLGIWDFGSGVYNAFGSITANCVFFSPGRPNYMVVQAEVVDNNGYPWLVTSTYSTIWSSAEDGTMQFLRAIEKDSNDPMLRAFEDYKRTKR